MQQIRLRWVDHRLHGDAVVRVGSMILADADRLATEAEATVKRHLPNVDEMIIRVVSAG